MGKSSRGEKKKTGKKIRQQEIIAQIGGRVSLGCNRCLSKNGNYKKKI